MLLESPPQLVATYSVAELVALLGGNALGQTLLQTAYVPLCTISVYHLEYDTVDPAGNLTPASGALMVPSGSAACEGGRPIVEYAHGTQTDQSFDIANFSTSENDEGILLAAVFAAAGYIVVAPNYVGYDISTLGYHPYLVASQQADDMIDALSAARSALPTAAAPSTTDGGKLFVTGYSQGGYVAMATHRAMQAAGTAVTAAAPLSGPYALSAFGDAIFAGEVSLSATLNVIMIAGSYQHTYGNLYAASTDVFSSTYATGIESLLPSTTPVSTLESENKLPTSALFSSTPPNPAYAGETPATAPATLAAVFAQGFAASGYLVLNSYRSSYLEDAAAHPDGGFPLLTDAVPPASPSLGLRIDLKTNDLRSWAPTAPELLCAGSSDPTVFYINTQLMQDYWALIAPTAPVTVLDIDSPIVAGEPYGALKTDFAAAEDLVRAAAIAAGATDGGESAVLDKYHATLVAPFCLTAARQFFDGY
jgi:poly(3-hydroxybutyrate) depolymerase